MDTKIVSEGLKELVSSAMDLSAARLRPTSMSVTFTSVRDDGLDEQAASAASSRQTSATRADLGIMTFSSSDFSVPRSLGFRNSQLLTGIDEVGILDDVPVRLEDPAPLARVAVLALRDLRETVAF